MTDNIRRTATHFLWCFTIAFCVFTAALTYKAQVHAGLAVSRMNYELTRLRFGLAQQQRKPRSRLEESIYE